MDTIELYDRVPIGGVKRDAAGNLICSATIARTGVYDYAGFEVGRPEQRRVRIYRPPEEVFHRDAMRSVAGAPVTLDHPSELVTTDNWSKFARGEASSDEIVRDGEVIRVPFMLRDENAIKAVEDGKHELSPGYTALIDWTAGQTESGEAYDAVCRRIRVNHIAIVDKARGGSECRIGDGKTEDKVDTKTILVDGLQVEVTDAAEAAITKLQGRITELSDKLTAEQTARAEADKAKGTLEGEKAALEKRLQDATDPTALQKAAADRSALCDKAKALLSTIVTDGKDDATIRKEVVTAKLGDVAKDFDEAQIAGAFATLAATVKVKDGKGKDALAAAISDSGASDEDIAALVEKRNAAVAKRNAHLNDAHRGGDGDKE